MGRSNIVPSAVCYSCETGNEQPMQIPIVDGRPRPDLVTGKDTQSELLQAIFDEDSHTEFGTTIESLKKKRKPWSPFDLVSGTFRALGFGKKKEAEIDMEQVEFATSDQETSKQVAKRKQRKPIFGPEEDTKK